MRNLYNSQSLILQWCHFTGFWSNIWLYGALTWEPARFGGVESVLQTLQWGRVWCWPAVGGSQLLAEAAGSGVPVETHRGSSSRPGFPVGNISSRSLRAQSTETTRRCRSSEVKLTTHTAAAAWSRRTPSSASDWVCAEAGAAGCCSLLLLLVLCCFTAAGIRYVALLPPSGGSPPLRHL